jgi:hypothetical protein
MRRFAGGIGALGLLLVACNPATPEKVAPANEASPAREARVGGFAFVNRVWVVDSSNAVAKGSMYVFLADRTLVLSAPGSTPALGRWSFEQGRLKMIEEGIAYDVDILEIRGDRFRIVSHNPGGAVTLEMRDARPDWIDAEP